jgi:predicted amidohydrolase
MYKVGAVQLEDLQGDAAASLRIIRLHMMQADNKGVDILCFPECFLQGYTLDTQQTKERALDLSSPEFEAILSELAEYKTTVILGLIEKDNKGFYNTAAVIRQGKVLGKYRKVHLFEENFQPGTEQPVFLLDDLKFGVNICYDARFSEGATALSSQGAKIIFYPLNNRLPSAKAAMYRNEHITNLIDRAKESSCWVVAADVVAEDEDFTGYGCTAIVDPEGNVAARVAEREVGMVTFKIA